MPELAENEIFIPEQEETQESDPITEESLSEEGVSPQEIDLIKNNGLLPEKEEISKEEKNEKESQEENKEDLVIESLDSFEKVHELFEQKPEKFRELPKNIKALYHNSKGLYKKLKIEEGRRQEKDKAIEESKTKEKDAFLKLGKIKEVLSKENLSIEDIEEILGAKVGEKNEEVEEEKPKEVDKSQAIQQKLLEAEKIGKTEYENFDDLMARAIDYIYKTEKGVVVRDEKGMPTIKRKIYFNLLNNSLLDDNISEHELVDIVADIAKLNPKEEVEKPAEKVNEKVDRMIKNAAKKPTSASIGSGSRGQVKTYDNLTLEDLVNMNQSDYNKVPDAVRKKLLA